MFLAMRISSIHQQIVGRIENKVDQRSRQNHFAIFVKLIWLWDLITFLSNLKLKLGLFQQEIPSWSMGEMLSFSSLSFSSNFCKMSLTALFLLRSDLFMS